MENTETITPASYCGWIARYGTPLSLTNDQGRQFESQLFKELDSERIKTTAYHLAANDMVERLHRQLKAAIRCYEAQR